MRERWQGLLKYLTHTKKLKKESKKENKKHFIQWIGLPFWRNLLEFWMWKSFFSLLDQLRISDYLSSVVQLKVVPVNGISCLRQPKIEQIKRVDIFLLENLSNFSEELSNCSTFAEKLSSGVDIFVNDAFSQCHKVLASTVGVTRFCYASIAGFQFEEELSLVREITRSNGQPYIAIVCCFFYVSYCTSFA